MSAVHKASKRQETAAATRYGGRRTPGSGNQWDRKNDVRSERFSFELKTTTKQQYPLKASELEEGEKHALRDGRDFVFGVEFNGRNWFVISQEDFDLLLEQAGVL